MIIARAALLVLGIATTAAAWGALQMAQQPSALRVVVTSITALVAPLFWPGAADTTLRTALRVVNWSLVCAVSAALMLLAMGQGRQTPSALLAVAAMLSIVLVIVHCLAATLELRLATINPDPQVARAMAAAITTFALALVGAAPLWLGPAAELSASAHTWAVDAILAASPLTHLAMASGNDLLHSEWLYDHSNLSKLAVSYPGMSTILALYASILLALVGIPLAQRHLRRRMPDAHPPCSTTEEVR